MHNTRVQLPFTQNNAVESGIFDTFVCSWALLQVLRGERREALSPADNSVLLTRIPNECESFFCLYYTTKAVMYTRHNFGRSNWRLKGTRREYRPVRTYALESSIICASTHTPNKWITTQMEKEKSRTCRLIGSSIQLPLSRDRENKNDG